MDGDAVSEATPDAPARHSALQRDMIRGSLWTLLASTIGIPLSLLVSVVTVHQLGPHEYGTYALYVAVFAFAVPVANGGFTEATMQWVAEHNARGQLAEIRMLVRKCSGYHLTVQFPVLAVVVCVLLWRANPVLIGVTLLAVAATVLTEASAVVLMGTMRNDLVARFSMVMNLASSTSICVTAAVDPSASAVWVAGVAATFVVPFLSFLALPADLRRAVFQPVIPRDLPTGFRSYAVSALVSGVLSLAVFGRSEIFALSAYGEVLNVALYAIASTLAGKITVLIDSLMAPLASASAGLIATSPERGPSALVRVLRVSSLLGGLTAGALVPICTVLLAPVFGQRFGAAEDAFVALAVLSCLQSIAVPVAAFAFATRSAAAIMRVNLVCVIVDVAVAFGGVPLLGLAGAVLANCSAQVLNMLLVVRVVARRLAITPASILRVCAPCVPGFLGTACGLVVAHLPLDPVLAGGGSVLVAGAVVVIMFRWQAGFRLEAQDMASILDAMPRSLARPAAALTSWLHVVDDPARAPRISAEAS